MKTVKRIICALLLVSMLASMFFAVSAAESDSKKEERTGITIDKVTTNGVTHPEGYYLSDKKLEEIPVTYEAWVYMPSSKTYPQDGNVILSNAPHIYAMGTDNWFSFELKNGSEPKLIFGYRNKEVTEVVFWDKGRIPKDKWTHLVLVHDTTAKTVSCYLNGELKETKSFNFKPDKTTIDNLLFLAGDGYSANRRAFTGTLGDVAVYADVRTYEEVKSDYENGADVNDKDVILYYQISSENQNKDIKDVSGNGYNMNYYRMMLTESQMDQIRKQDENEYAYSIAFIPDTQYIVSKFPDKFKPIYDYILENKDKKNIKYVIGLGDMTDENSNKEWNIVKEQIDRLNGVIPYSIIRGNHDGVWKNQPNTYDSIFANPNSAYYKHVAANGGFYKQNSVKNTYLLFEENNVKYMILNLDYGISEDVLKWADKVISEHPNHRVMIVTHAWLNINAEPYTATDWAAPGNEVLGSTNPDKMWKQHFKKHANIDMIVCGHTNSDQVLVTPVIGDNGNTVYQILMDGQYADISTFNGLGLVGLMYFTADGRFAKVEYYSTAYDRYYYEGHTDIHLDLDAVASDSIDISGKVTLEGKDIAAGDFGFILTPASSKFEVDLSAAPVKVTNAADGSFVFKDVTFYKAGTYRFVISTDAENSIDSVTLDESVYHVTVKVKKNSKGELAVSETHITKKGSSEAAHTVIFANAYTGPVKQDTSLTWIWIAAGALVGVGVIAGVLVLVLKKKRAKKA